MLFKTQKSIRKHNKFISRAEITVVLVQNDCNKISIHGKRTGVRLLLETQKHAWFCYKLQDPGEEHWDNLIFISQLLYETSLLVAIKNTTSDYKKKRKIDFFQILPRLFSFFFAMKCSKSQWHHRKIQDSCNCPTTTNNQRPNIVLLLSVTSLMRSAFIILQVCKE